MATTIEKFEAWREDVTRTQYEPLCRREIEAPFKSAVPDLDSDETS